MIYPNRVQVNYFRLAASVIFVVSILSIAIITCLGMTSDKKPSPQIPAGSYARYATGINIYGSPKNWYSMAERYGYYLSSKPVSGGVVCFQDGAYGTNITYGFVGVVSYYYDEGTYWTMGTRYTYSSKGDYYYDQPYVEEKEFRVLKNDRRVHFIYRADMNSKRAGYYLRPEYDGQDIVGRRYALGNTGADITIYPKTRYAKAYIRPGQIIRLLPKAEAGETLWVFVTNSARKGEVYALTGNETNNVRRFKAYFPSANQMYYAKNYGDTVLDLGYADYSKIAQGAGTITLTVKKGGDPRKLVPLQTITLQVVKR